MISFQCEKCNYLALIWSGGPDQFTASKKYAPLGPHNILKLAAPTLPPYLKPSYAYGREIGLYRAMIYFGVI